MISTNIAETSITIEDCVVVVDSGRVKENRYDENKQMAVSGITIHIQTINTSCRVQTLKCTRIWSADSFRKTPF